MGRGWRGDRHNANLPDFFACQMTEPPLESVRAESMGGYHRTVWGLESAEERTNKRARERVRERERGEGGMKSVLCLETMPILGYILISILRLDAAPYRKGLPLFIPD